MRMTLLSCGLLVIGGSMVIAQGVPEVTGLAELLKLYGPMGLSLLLLGSGALYFARKFSEENTKNDAARERERMENDKAHERTRQEFLTALKEHTSSHHAAIREQRTEFLMALKEQRDDFAAISRGEEPPRRRDRDDQPPFRESDPPYPGSRKRA